MGLRRVPAGELRAHPGNWRSHPAAQRGALVEMLGRLGWVSALVARETPEGLELVDGHLRADVAGGEEVPVLVVDLDEAEAAEALATLDPLAAMAEADAEALAGLLDGLDDLPPGFSDAPMLGDMMAAMEAAGAAGDGERAARLTMCPACGHEW